MALAPEEAAAAPAPGEVEPPLPQVFPESPPEEPFLQPIVSNTTCPESNPFCIRNALLDDDITSALIFNTSVGAIFMFFFGIFYTRVPVYKMRTVLQQVAVKPPPLPEGSCGMLWKWLFHTIAISDNDILESAGLDALMLAKTMAFGVQLFLPLTLVVAAILIPIHVNGGFAKEAAERELVPVGQFSRMTASNVKPGSDIFWVHMILVYAIIAYAIVVLRYHHRAFVRLRQRYLSGGVDENLWRRKYQFDVSPEIQKGTGNKKRRLVQLATFRKSALQDQLKHSGGTLAIASSMEPIKTRALVRALSSRRYEEVGSIDDSSRDGSGLAWRDSPEQCKTPKTEERTPETSDVIAGQQGRSGSLESACNPNIGKLQHTDTAVTDTHVDIETEHSAGGNDDDQDIEGCTKRPSQILRWWSMGTDSGNPEQKDTEKVLTTRPSCRFLKTVNTQASDGRTVAVNAQQYTVLLTNVPDLDRVLEGRRGIQRNHTIWKRLWSHLLGWDIAEMSKTRLGTAHSRTLSQIRHGTSHPGAKPAVCGENEVEAQEQKRQPQSSEEVIEKNEVELGPVSSTEIQIQESSSQKPLLKKKSNGAKEPRHGTLQQVSELDVRSGTIASGKDASPITPSSDSAAECVISGSFRRLFPKDFVRATPILVHKKVDELLFQWDKVSRKLELARGTADREAGAAAVVQHRYWWSCLTFGVFGVRKVEEAVPYYTKELLLLEEKINSERERVLKSKPTSSWLCFFRTQSAATIASQILLHSDGEKFQMQPAPGPDEMNWQALWKTSTERDIRTIIVLPFLAVLIFFPVGIFAGSLSMFNTYVCGDRESELWNSWYCQQSRTKSLVSGLLPSVLLAFWHNFVLPLGFYYLVQAMGRAVSFTALDRQIAKLYFYWDIATFLGAVLGGSFFFQLNAAVENASKIPELIGVAMPASSNFFIDYIAFRALFLLPLQLLLPTPSWWYYLLKLGGRCGCARTGRERAEILAPNSIRPGREYGVLMLVFLIGLAYSVTAPMILPFATLFFMLGWLAWRYQMLYVFVRKYESGGTMWHYVFYRLLICLWLFQFFTSSMLAMKKAYWQATILWITVPILLMKFYKVCKKELNAGAEHIALETAHMAPPAIVRPEVYTPPAMIPGSAVWHPEYMKAWEGWGMPAYTL
eukprot:evm.model.scf_220.3 EVM.evm.TU.scf_220.3   scf_220:31260-46576(+)